MKKILILFALGCLFFIQTPFAQDFPPPPRPGIRALIRSYGDSIVLRWAPDDAAAWSINNKYGYRILRGYVTTDSMYVSEDLTPEPLKPWPLQQMMDYFGPGDTLAAVAAQAIYGQAFEPVGVTGKEPSFADALRKQHEMQQTRFAFALQAAEFSSQVAKAIGMRFCDKNVRKGVLYDYYIQSLVPPDIVEILPASLIIPCQPADPLKPPTGLDIKQLNNQSIELIWSRDENPGFFIERSTDRGITYHRINRKPYYSTLPDHSIQTESEELLFYRSLLDDYHILSDTITIGKTYHYRLRGITSFTELTPFSGPVSISTLDIEPPVAPLIEPVEIIENRIARIRWINPDPPSDLKGYIVEKARTVQGEFVAVHEGLLSATTFEFSDTTAYHRTSNYYRVVAMDQSGNRAESFEAAGTLDDKTPPSTPGDLAGIIYFDGVVELYWEDNTEEDLEGYRVLYANHPEHEFVLLTPYPIKGAFFSDTVFLKTLTKKIYFKVLAEDRSGNQSLPTPVLELSRPDIVPPTVPVVLEANQDAENVFITWSASASNDVVGYRIFRKLENAELWENIGNINAEDVEDHVSFTDSPASSGDYYLYTIEAIDESGNSSGICKPIPFRVRGKSVIDVPLTISATYDAKSYAVLLSWQCNQSGVYYVSLHRAINDDPIEVIKTFERSQTNYTDTRVPKGAKVHYAVQIHLPDGRTSKLSETVLLNIPN